MIVPSTVSVKNWQAFRLFKGLFGYELLQLRLGFRCVAIRSLSISLFSFLFHAKAPRQNTKAAKKSFAALRNLSAFA
jgi:hypothetical protein